MKGLNSKEGHGVLFHQNMLTVSAIFSTLNKSIYLIY